MQRWVAPLLEPFLRNHPRIQLLSTTKNLPSVSNVRTILGEPISTNSDGSIAWILSPSDLEAFTQELKATTEAKTLSSSAISTRSGMQCVMLSGTSVPAFVRVPPLEGTQASSIQPVSASSTNSQGPSKFIDVGFRIDVTPKSVSGLIRLPLTASSTSQSTWTITNGVAVPVIETNYFVACRALVPNAGALVISCTVTNAAQPEYRLLIFAPTLIDAKGQPIKR